MKRLSIVWGCVFLIILLAGTVQVVASTIEWKAYETEHFIVFFPDGYQYQAQETAYYLEKMLPRVQQITGHEHGKKIRIIVQDVGIDSNGYAQPVTGKIGIFTNSPTSGGNLNSYQNWFRLVSGHELTHMYHLTHSSGAGAVLPFIFGNVAAGNMAVPGWMIEGITVYNESVISPYEGRMNDGYFDALIAAKAQADQLPDILEAAYPHDTYPKGQWYLYGGAFVRYLAKTYGEAKIVQFFDDHGRNPLAMVGAVVPALGMDRAAKQVFGKTFPTLFEEWIAAEKTEHQQWKIDGATVIDSKRGYIFDLQAYQGKLYYLRSTTLTPAPHQQVSDIGLVEWDPSTQKERILMRFAQGSEARLQMANHRIYVMVGERTGGFANVDQRGLGGMGVLYSYDLATGAKTRLLTDVVKAFGIMPNGDIIFCRPRKEAYGSEVWKVSSKGMVLLGVTDQIITELQWYRDGFIVVGKSNQGSWNIQYFDPTSLLFQPIVDTPWAEFGIALAGDTLYYTANYHHEYAIYQYHLGNGTVNRVTQGNFAMYPAMVGSDLYFRGVTADGDAIFKTVPTPTPYSLGEREVVQQEEMKTFVSGLKEINAAGKSYLNLLQPFNRFFPTFLAGEDGLGLNRYTLSYSPLGGIDLYFQTSELLPLELGVSHRIVHANRDRETVLTAFYPVHTSSQYGLTSVTLSGWTNLRDRTVGELGVNLQFPRQGVNLSIQGGLGGGIAADANYSYVIEHGRLSIHASTFDAFDAAVTVRGVGSFGGKAVSGNGFSFNVTHKLAEVRKGFWNTSLFFADLYGNLFMDHTSFDGGHSSIGAEVIWEMGAAFGATLTPRMGLAYAENEGIRPIFGMNLTF